MESTWKIPSSDRRCRRLDRIQSPPHGQVSPDGLIDAWQRHVDNPCATAATSPYAVPPVTHHVSGVFQTQVAADSLDDEQTGTREYNVWLAGSVWRHHLATVDSQTACVGVIRLQMLFLLFLLFLMLHVVRVLLDAQKNRKLWHLSLTWSQFCVQEEWAFINLFTPGSLTHFTCIIVTCSK